MALSDHDIVIFPNKGQTEDPKIVFSGADATTGAKNITLRVYPTNNGTVSLEGSVGQLLSVSNTMSGSIFSVNDISGIPSIDVDDTGVVKIAPYNGSLTIGSSTAGTYKFTIYDQNNNGFGMYQSNDSDGALFRTHRSKGTLAAPTAVTTDTNLAGIRTFGLNSSGTYNPMSASIDFYAAENFTSTAGGSYITLRTTAIGTVGSVERFRIGPDGTVSITSSAISYGMFRLTGTGATTTECSMSFGLTGEADPYRWVIGKNVNGSDSRLGIYYGGERLSISTGGAVTIPGAITTNSGIRNTGGSIRFDGNGDGTFSGSTGIGGEFYQTTGIVVLQSFNRTTSNFSPMKLSASSVEIAAPASFTGSATVTGNVILNDEYSAGRLNIGTNGAYIGRYSPDGSVLIHTGQGAIYMNNNSYSNADGVCPASFVFDCTRTTGNGAGARFINHSGSHSWGVVAEFGTRGTGDRPSILFNSSVATTRWSIGYVGSDDQFRIVKNHGYVDSSWGAEYLRISTTGVMYLGAANNVIISANGDFRTQRNGGTTGTYYFGTGDRYLHYDGSNFSFGGQNVYAGGYWGAGTGLSGTAASLTAGNATTVNGIASNELLYGNNGFGAWSSTTNMNDNTVRNGVNYALNPTNGLGTWTTWMNVIGHGTGDRYGYQLASSYWDDNLYFRKVVSNAWGTTWHQITHKENIGSHIANITAATSLYFNSDHGIRYSSTHWVVPRDASNNIHIRSGGGVYSDGTQHHFRNTSGTDWLWVATNGETYVANACVFYGGLYINGSGSGNYGLGLFGQYSDVRYQGIFAMSGSYKLATDGTTSGNLYGIAWTHSNIGGESKAGLSHQMLVMENGVTKTALGTGIWTAGTITTTAGAYISGSLTVSANNATGGGIILADDGDIVDLNDAYCSMRFSSGVRIYSAKSGGSAVITLGNNGDITSVKSSSVTFGNWNGAPGSGVTGVGTWSALKIKNNSSADCGIGLYTNGDAWLGTIYAHGGSVGILGTNSDWKVKLSNSDGNIWMAWAGDWLSTLLGARVSKTSVADFNSNAVDTFNRGSYWNDTTNNLPVSSASGGSQWWNTINVGDSGRHSQLTIQAYGTGAGIAPQNAMYVRSKHDSGWSAWVKVVTEASGNAPTASSAVKLDGANAYTNGSDGWFRSNGDAGWYSATYAVGIYSTGASWVSTYNGSNFAITGSYLRLNGAARKVKSDGTNTGFTDGSDNLCAYVDGANAFVVTNTLWLSGNPHIYKDAPTIYLRDTDGRSCMLHNNGNRFYLLRGTGNASDSWATSNGYWPMDFNLDNNDVTLGGNVTAAYNITAYSDERLKKDWTDIPANIVEKLAKVKNGTYTRIDISQLRQIGVSAQSLREVLPEAVMEADNEEKMLSVSYGNAALAMCVELAKEIVLLKEEINKLKGVK